MLRTHLSDEFSSPIFFSAEPLESSGFQRFPDLSSHLNSRLNSMSLNESIVEEAALTWFGELGYVVRYGPQVAPGEPGAERDAFGDVVLMGRLREALQRRRDSMK